MTLGFRSFTTGRDELAASLSLCALTAAAVVALGRLFTDGSILGPTLLTVAAVHAMVWILRASGANLFVAAIASSVLTVQLVAWLILPDTTFAGFATGATFSTAREEIANAWKEFGAVAAPVRINDGFVIAAMIAAATCAFLADWAAFRLYATNEAAIPSFGLLVFAAALRPDYLREPSVALYLLALLAFLTLTHPAFRASASSWLGGAASSAKARLVAHGFAVALVGVSAALVIGPLVPGVDSESALKWRPTERENAGDGNDDRVTISPLVDIRSRLVEHSGAEVFTVEASERAYWRLTSLDTFNGETWSANSTYEDVDGRLPQPDADPRTRKVAQRFEIVNLDAVWLPAAYRAVEIDAEGAGFDEETESLLGDPSTGIGTTYEVVSELPTFSADELRRARGSIPADVADRYLHDAEVSPAVAAHAETLVEDARTPYDRALALQDHLRSFEYDLDVPPGHSGDAMEVFLFETQRGYCEQFAGTYAAMARSIGLPARVAVGFTPGELGTDGKYHVRDLNAHAWPEVYFADLGWVAFEPTPGRGAPFSTEHTGVTESQANPAAPEVATTVTTAPSSPTTTRQPSAPATTPTTATDRPAPGDPERSRGMPVLLRIIGMAVGVIVLLALLAASTRYMRAARRRSRIRSAETPDQQIELAWQDALHAVEFLGVRRRPSETFEEYALRATRKTSLPGLDAIARYKTISGYSPSSPSVDQADAAMSHAEEIGRKLAESFTLWEKLQWEIVGTRVGRASRRRDEAAGRSPSAVR